MGVLPCPLPLRGGEGAETAARAVWHWLADGVMLESLYLAQDPRRVHGEAKHQTIAAMTKLRRQRTRPRWPGRDPAATVGRS